MNQGRGAIFTGPASEAAGQAVIPSALAPRLETGMGARDGVVVSLAHGGSPNFRHHMPILIVRGAPFPCRPAGRIGAGTA